MNMSLTWKSPIKANGLNIDIDPEETNLDDAISRLKFEWANHLKGMFIQTIKERYMKDSSFGMKQYVSELIFRSKKFDI